MYNCSASFRASIRSLLLPSFSKAIFRGLHTTTSVTCGFSKSYNQAAQVPSSNVTCKSPRSPSMNCRMVFAFVSMTHSITILPSGIHHRNRNAFLVNIHADILGASHKGCSFLEGLSRALKTYSKSRLLRNSVDRPKINEKMPS